MNYYKKSIEKMKELLQIDESLTEEEWNEYRKGKALYGSTTIMWIYSQTEDWGKFIKQIKQELKD